jgi:hypothetical protein
MAYLKFNKQFFISNQPGLYLKLNGYKININFYFHRMILCPESTMDLLKTAVLSFML